MESEAKNNPTISELIKQGVIVAHKDGNHGSNYPRSHEFGDQGVPFLTAKLVSDSGRIDFDNAPRLNHEKAQKIKFGYLEAGDVLLSHNATVGRVALVPELKEKVLIGTSLTHFRLDARRLLPKYLAAYFKGRDFQNQLSAVMGGMSTRNQVPITAQRQLRVAVPPLNEQKAIAHILGSLDDKIELNRQMNTTLEAMAQALFKSWFVDFDPVIDNALAAGHPIPEALQKRAAARKALGDQRGFSDAFGLPEAIQKRFPNRFVFNDDMGWVPEGWVSRPVDQAILINPKVTLKKGEVAPFVDMKALPTSGFDIGEVIQKAYRGGAKFQQGDVLFARITPCLENGKTGLVDFLDENEVGFGSTEFIVMRGKGVLKRAFVACLARHTAFRSHCELGMVGSSGRQRVQNSSFGDYYLALPTDESLLERFDQLVQPSFEKMSTGKSQSIGLVKLRDTLLPKLLSGQLRIPDAAKQLEAAGA